METDGLISILTRSTNENGVDVMSSRKLESLMTTAEKLAETGASSVFDLAEHINRVEAMLVKAEEIASKGASHAFDLARHVWEVLKDRDFISAVARGESSIEDRLDNCVKKCCALTRYQLRETYNRHPRREEWVEIGVFDLWDKTKKAIDEEDTRQKAAAKLKREQGRLNEEKRIREQARKTGATAVPVVPSSPATAPPSAIRPNGDGNGKLLNVGLTTPPSATTTTPPPQAPRSNAPLTEKQEQEYRELVAGSNGSANGKPPAEIVSPARFADPGCACCARIRKIVEASKSATKEMNLIRRELGIKQRKRKPQRA